MAQGDLVGAAFDAAQLALGSVLVFMPQNMTQSLLALACIMLFLFFMQMCISPVYWLLMSELFPMKVRGVLTGTPEYVGAKQPLMEERD